MKSTYKHCIIRFVINAALLNANLFLIYSYTTIYFFVKKCIFSNVYVSVSTIFECHQLSTYRQLVVDGECSSRMRNSAYRGLGVSHLICTCALALFLFMFLAAFLS